MIEPRSPASGLAAQRESLAPSIVIIVALVFVGRGKPSPTRWLRRRHANGRNRRIFLVAVRSGKGLSLNALRTFPACDGGGSPSPQAVSPRRGRASRGARGSNEGKVMTAVGKGFGCRPGATVDAV